MKLFKLSLAAGSFVNKGPWASPKLLSGLARICIDIYSVMVQCAHLSHPSSFVVNERPEVAFEPPLHLRQSSTRPADGHPLQTSGYGYHQMGSNGRPISQVSRYLKWTDMEYVSVSRCKSIWTGQTIDNSVICADAPTASICSGDSGGPLVIQEGGEWRLIGLTSWAHVYCRTTGLPQGWANVQWPEYNAWMRENAGL